MSDFIETGEYRGFKIGHQDVCSGDEIYEIVHQENGGQL